MCLDNILSVHRSTLQVPAAENLKTARFLLRITTKSLKLYIELICRYNSDDDCARSVYLQW